MIKAIAAAALTGLLLVTVSACGSQTAAQSRSGEPAVSQSAAARKTAKEGASMQKTDAGKATRIPMAGGTPVKIHFGDTVIHGVLNDSETAKALIRKLPYTVHMDRYSHDFCGVTEKLPYREEEVHYGWLNGDIDYATDAPYFTILFKDEDSSEQYGHQVNIGVMTSPIADIDSLHGSYDVTIELDS
ncbi:cyclophilin-like fold protein [Dialister sp.]|uniref:cyclophilin-like fold protein n=1 Tax=Dialister sp. TaxID=1955814 RepID=UPI003F001EC3